LLVIQKLDGAKARFSSLTDRLNSISPLATMKRGYTAVSRDNLLIRSVSEVDEGDTVSLRFYDGVAETRITKKGSSI
jgi:exodeoxyribonuclease VII large subunit